MPEYAPAVAQLLTRGDPGKYGSDWPDYRAMGLGPEQVPDLVRMALDPELNEADSESTEVWAPLHAWRALGQLRAEAATQPLLELFDRQVAEFDDSALEEMPEVFALIGPSALPALEAFLAEPSHEEYARIGVSEALGKMAENHPQSRSDCVAILSRQLAKAEHNPSSLNGFLVSALLQLDGVEAAPIMERAFAAGQVDWSIAGDWDEVQYELGLTDSPPPPRRHVVLETPPTARPLTPRARAKARAKKAKKERRRKHKRR